jgi:hypothetical protein
MTAGNSTASLRPQGSPAGALADSTQASDEAGPSSKRAHHGDGANVDGATVDPEVTQNDDDGEDPDDVDDPTQGEWLFRQKDMVLGPVSAAVLIDKIHKDELSAETPIARDGQPFQPMMVRRLFREAFSAHEDEKRFAAQERAYRAAQLRARNGRMALLAMVFALPAGLAAVFAHQVVDARPWDDTPAWLARVPPVVELPQRPPEARTQVLTPSASGTAPAGTGSEDPGSVAGTATGAGTGARRPGAGGNGADIAGSGASGVSGVSGTAGADGSNALAQTGAAADAAGGAHAAAGAAGGPASAALPETLTNAQAIEPLKGAQAALKACFKTEMEENPETPTQVVLSYTITEQGLAANVELDARELRDRPVVPCVQQAMAALRWPRFSGERKNVSVPFKLGKAAAKK